MNSTLIKIDHHPLYQTLIQPTTHFHYVGPRLHDASGVLLSITPPWTRIICTLSVPNRLYLFYHDPFASLGSRHVRTSWITTHSYLLDHDTFVPLGSRHDRRSWITIHCILGITMHPLVIGTLWSSYPLILATLGISYLLVTCILWYLTTFGNS